MIQTEMNNTQLDEDNSYPSSGITDSDIEEFNSDDDTDTSSSSQSNKMRSSLSSASLRDNSRSKGLRTIDESTEELFANFEQLQLLLKENQEKTKESLKQKNSQEYHYYRSLLESVNEMKELDKASSEGSKEEKKVSHRKKLNIMENVNSWYVNFIPMQQEDHSRKTNSGNYYYAEEEQYVSSVDQGALESYEDILRQQQRQQNSQEEDDEKTIMMSSSAKKNNNNYQVARRHREYSKAGEKSQFNVDYIFKEKKGNEPQELSSELFSTPNSSSTKLILDDSSFQFDSSRMLSVLQKASSNKVDEDISEISNSISSLLMSSPSSKKKQLNHTNGNEIDNSTNISRLSYDGNAITPEPPTSSSSSTASSSYQSAAANVASPISPSTPSTYFTTPSFISNAEMILTPKKEQLPLTSYDIGPDCNEVNIDISSSISRIKKNLPSILDENEKAKNIVIPVHINQCATVNVENKANNGAEEESQPQLPHFAATGNLEVKSIASPEKVDKFEVLIPQSDSDKNVQLKSDEALAIVNPENVQFDISSSIARVKQKAKAIADQQNEDNKFDISSSITRIHLTNKPEAEKKGKAEAKVEIDVSSSLSRLQSPTNSVRSPSVTENDSTADDMTKIDVSRSRSRLKTPVATPSKSSTIDIASSLSRLQSPTASSHTPSVTESIATDQNYENIAKIDISKSQSRLRTPKPKLNDAYTEEEKVSHINISSSLSRLQSTSRSTYHHRHMAKQSDEAVFANASIMNAVELVSTPTKTETKIPTIKPKAVINTEYESIIFQMHITLLSAYLFEEQQLYHLNRQTLLLCSNEKNEETKEKNVLQANASAPADDGIDTILIDISSSMNRIKQNTNKKSDLPERSAILSMPKENHEPNDNHTQKEDEEKPSQRQQQPKKKSILEFTNHITSELYFQKDDVIPTQSNYSHPRVLTKSYSNSSNNSFASLSERILGKNISQDDNIQKIGNVKLTKASFTNRAIQMTKKKLAHKLKASSKKFHMFKLQMPS